MTPSRTATHFFIASRLGLRNKGLFLCSERILLCFKVKNDFNSMYFLKRQGIVKSINPEPLPEDEGNVRISFIALITRVECQVIEHIPEYVFIYLYL
jgi:hypothetical protein